MLTRSQCPRLFFLSYAPRAAHSIYRSISPAAFAVRIRASGPEANAIPGAFLAASK